MRDGDGAGGGSTVIKYWAYISLSNNHIHNKCMNLVNINLCSTQHTYICMCVCVCVFVEQFTDKFSLNFRRFLFDLSTRFVRHVNALLLRDLSVAWAIFN